MTTSAEGKRILKFVSTFLQEYAPFVKTGSEHTIRGYKTALDQYLEWLEDCKKYSVSDITSQCFEARMIEDWLIWLQKEKKQSKSTVNVRLASIRTFIKYLAKQDPKYRYLAAEAADVSRVKAPKKKIHGMTKEAVKALLSVIPTNTVSGRRYLLMITLLYATAGRLDEILSLKISDLYLNEKNPFIRVLGKGSKWRNIPILESTKQFLQVYIQSFHGESPDPNAYLFFTKHKGMYEKMSQTAVRKMLRQYAEEAHKICSDCPTDLHPHQMRHSKATHLLGDGLSDVVVAEFLGHSGLHTIQDYVDVSMEQKRKSIDTLKDDHDRQTAKKWKDTDKISIRTVARTKK